ncbi:peroxisomal membrane protein PEX13-like [Lampetra fluviatilis]
MASQPPPKPWERRAVPNSGVNPAFRAPEAPGGEAWAGQGGPGRAAPPPLPPRPTQSSSAFTSMGSAYRPGFSSYTSPHAGSLYGVSSPYYNNGMGYGLGFGGSQYGGYGYSRFREQNTSGPSRFVRTAEESSRTAFQSVESIVHAFSSVSMMLDATFSAVYNSFRAVLDVADHFSRLRMQFTNALSAFALVRTIRFLYGRLLALLGLRSKSEVDAAWVESCAAGASIEGASVSGAGRAGPKSWPILLFFAVVLGGPYLIWKLLSAAAQEPETGCEWASGEDDHIVARAGYDFTATSDEEISFRAGDVLILAPKEQQPRVRGWLLASRDGVATGLAPANYVQVLGKRRGRRTAAGNPPLGAAAVGAGPPTLGVPQAGPSTPADTQQATGSSATTPQQQQHTLGDMEELFNAVQADVGATALDNQTQATIVAVPDVEPECQDA